MRESRLLSLALIAPALLVVAALFVLPLGYSVASAFRNEAGNASLDNFAKAFEFYAVDIGYTVIIIGSATLVVGVLGIAIGGYLVLGANARAVAILRWLYRWPLFIPFIVAGQIMRAFLAKHGLLNNSLVAVGLIEPMQASSLLDWQGLIITFAWKQTPFVALLLSGAMASLDPAGIEAARNLGASRLRILVGIIVPQVRATLMVGLILSFVTMMSVLSVPMMISRESPTMLTVDMAFRINFYGDYGTANALGVISCVMTAAVAWLYLRHAVQETRT